MALIPVSALAGHQLATPITCLLPPVARGRYSFGALLFSHVEETLLTFLCLSGHKRTQLTGRLSSFAVRPSSQALLTRPSQCLALRLDQHPCPVLPLCVGCAGVDPRWTSSWTSSLHGNCRGASLLLCCSGKLETDQDVTFHSTRAHLLLSQIYPRQNNGSALSFLSPPEFYTRYLGNGPVAAPAGNTATDGSTYRAGGGWGFRPAGGNRLGATPGSAGGIRAGAGTPTAAAGRGTTGSSATAGGSGSTGYRWGSGNRLGES